MASIPAAARPLIATIAAMAAMDDNAAAAAVTAAADALCPYHTASRHSRREWRAAVLQVAREATGRGRRPSPNWVVVAWGHDDTGAGPMVVADGPRLRAVQRKAQAAARRATHVEVWSSHEWARFQAREEAARLKAALEASPVREEGGGIAPFPG